VHRQSTHVLETHLALNEDRVHQVVKSSSMSRLISFWPIFVLNAVALIGLWIWTERYGEHHWLATILAYIPQHLYGLPTVLLLIWAVRNQNLFGATANLIVLIGFLITFMGFNIPKSNASSSKSTLRFVTYNLHQDNRAIATLKRLNPDVAVLQESRDVNGLQNDLRTAFPNFFIQHENELTTISRFPIRDTRIYRLPNNRRPLLEVTLEISDQMVRVINTHYPTLDFQGLASRNTNTEDRINKNALVRLGMSKVLLELDQQTPLLIGGDFNTTPRGAMYSSLRDEYQNAFEQAGWGFGFTYSSRIPVIRIDHVWTNSKVRATRAFAVDDHASDHRPFVTDLELVGQ
jgi:vancomycin resistance protein VanJ